MNVVERVATGLNVFSRLRDLFQGTAELTTIRDESWEEVECPGEMVTSSNEYHRMVMHLVRVGLGLEWSIRLNWKDLQKAGIKGDEFMPFDRGRVVEVAEPPLEGLRCLANDIGDPSIWLSGEWGETMRSFDEWARCVGEVEDRVWVVTEHYKEDEVLPRIQLCPDNEVLADLQELLLRENGGVEVVWRREEEGVQVEGLDQLANHDGIVMRQGGNGNDCFDRLERIQQELHFWAGYMPVGGELRFRVQENGGGDRRVDAIVPAVVRWMPSSPPVSNLGRRMAELGGVEEERCFGEQCEEYVVIQPGFRSDIGVAVSGLRILLHQGGRMQARIGEGIYNLGYLDVERARKEEIVRLKEVLAASQRRKTKSKSGD